MGGLFYEVRWGQQNRTYGDYRNRVYNSNGRPILNSRGIM